MHRPRILLIGTGGTIAGTAPASTQLNHYSAGAIGAGELLQTVPQLQQLAEIEVEQIANVDSADLQFDHWCRLVAHIREALAVDSGLAGVVITHGTNTLEETAWLLQLLIDDPRPVVLVGAMRPSTALSADGPLNLFQAVQVAVSPEACGQGVLVMMNGQIHGARDVTKVATQGVGAFASPGSGPLGWLDDAGVHLPTVRGSRHVPFGLVQGDNGKKLKTRAGDTVRLRDLLDEAVERAEADLRRRLQEEERSEDEAFIQHVATTVGLAAVKYADLSQNRITNYQFSFDRMLALQGNTAPYLLYAVVRIAGIARKGGDLAGSASVGAGAAAGSGSDLHFNEPQEWALVRELLRFDAVIVEVEEELLPNRLCSYLFELSKVFNRFYDQVPVLKAEGATLRSRLALCRLTADTLKCGLGLLGIATLERM